MYKGLALGPENGYWGTGTGQWIVTMLQGSCAKCSRGVSIYPKEIFWPDLGSSIDSENNPHAFKSHGLIIRYPRKLNDKGSRGNDRTRAITKHPTDRNAE